MELTHRLRSKLMGSTRENGSDASKGAEAELQRKLMAKDFDPAFYATRYPDVTGDGLEHFTAFGWRENRDPAPWFSTAFYLETYPDVFASGLNPFFHYLEHGRAEGRLAAPAPAEQQDEEDAWQIKAIRDGMDEDFYAQQLRRADIDPSGADLALHYLREGARLGLDPTPAFSTSHYLSDHPDVAAVGVNPFAHYLQEGRKEGRNVRAVKAPTPAPKREAKKSAPREKGSSRGKPNNPDRELAASAFDKRYYLAANPDVAAAGVDPLDHFLASGWREGRNPTLWFSVTHYLEYYPDVAAAGINPFLHYLMAGKSEGRLPRHNLGFRYDVIAGLQPIEARIEHARTSSPQRHAANGEKLRDALRRASRLESKGLYLSVSHDDFMENFGGVQLVLMRESTAVDLSGFDHLHLFPATPLQTVEFDVADPIVGVLLNRKRVGFFRASVIERELAAQAHRIASLPFVIHSLIGHNSEALLAILKSAGCKSGWYWVHDYSSVCAGYTLLRNDVEFCGAPKPTSAACSMCVYGPFRVAQMAAHERLFEELDLTVLAPSDAALDLWKAGINVSAPAKVHEHLKLELDGAAKSRELSISRPLRVAYVGQPVTHKGWPVFRELTVNFADDPRYEFYHVGKGPQGIAATFREVAVGPDDLGAMVRTLSELEIDVAILWSLWPETFCIAAAEAFQAGAAVVTFNDSGNVAALVKKTGFGAVLDSEGALTALFESGDITKLAAQSRPAGLTASFSNMTADFVEGAVA